LVEVVSVKQLLEAGAHFGHQTSRWHPRMKKYIFTKREGIHIIDLEQTVTMLSKACEKGCGNLVMGDACKLPFKRKSFDAVISVHVLHLISDCDRALSEIKRVGVGILASVIHSSSEFHVRDDYASALEHSGFALKTPGIGEWGLKEIAQPSIVIGIEPYDDVLPIGERLNLLEKRKHSFAKDPPDDVHFAAIEFLKDQYRYKMDEHAKNQIEIVFWNIENLPDSLPRQ